MSKITVADCRRVVGLHFRIPKELMFSPKRSWDVARPRQMAMTLAHEFTVASLLAIGAHFGGRDHTTVLHAYRRIYDLERVNPEVRETMQKFRCLLSAYEAEAAE